jgi:hypothetical protein
MLASFVIPFHTARIDNLLQTLRFLTTDHCDIVRDCYLEAVCQDDWEKLPSDKYEALDTIREHFHRSCITSLNLKCMHLPYVINHGVENAETDKVIVLESDRLLPSGYFARVIDLLRPGLQITTTRMRKLTRPAEDEEIRNGTYDYVNEHRSIGNEIGRRNLWSGNTAFYKEDFFKAGKMDEVYKGYGWADSDMTAKVAATGIKSEFLDYTELHLWHPSATYGEGDQKQMFIKNGLCFCKKWGHPLPSWFREEIAAHKGIML